jgi:hypothetical protein
MQLLLDYLKIHELSNNPIFIVGNSAKSLFNDLNIEEFKNNQLIFIQHLETNPFNESVFISFEHPDFVNIDLNFINDCEYNLDSLNSQFQLFFEANKYFGALTKMNVVLSLDELLSQSFIDTMIAEQQVQRPKLSFKNVLLEVEQYFDKCLKNFKRVVSLDSANKDVLYTIVNN